MTQLSQFTKTSTWLLAIIQKLNALRNYEPTCVFGKFLLFFKTGVSKLRPAEIFYPVRGALFIITLFTPNLSIGIIGDMKKYNELFHFFWRSIHFTAIHQRLRRTGTFSLFLEITYFGNIHMFRHYQPLLCLRLPRKENGTNVENH